MSGGPPEGQAASVFLSYAREDRTKAQEIVSALGAQGLTVWWDGLVEGGHEFADKIEQALASADVVVVLWSSASVHSHWVRDEASTGRDRGRLVPVTIENAEPPLGFRQIHHIDLSKWRGGPGGPEIEQLYRAIRSASTTPHPEFRRPPRSKPVEFSRRNMMVAGAAGAVLVGGGIIGVSRLTGGPARETSIGVLPFRNLSGDSAEEYFSEGLAEELRATLSQNSDLAVAAEISSDVAGKKSSSPRAIASVLGVNFILEGSVRRETNMVRIAAQIVDGSSGFDKWSQTFDRKLDDILAVQSEIAAFVTDALLSGIMAAKRPRDRLGGTHSNEAFDAYLHGISLYKLAGGEESDFEALKEFQRAVALDPKYAVAQAALSRAYTVIANGYARAGQVKAYHQNAVDCAHAAIRVAPELADGYSALGFVLLNGELDPRSAAAAYQRSFELGYGNADILAAFASFAGRTGRFADGRIAIARAQRLDPLNANVFRTAGLLEFDARQYESALTALHAALSLNPNSNTIHLVLGDIALLSGDANAALGQYRQEPDPIGRLRGVAIAEMKLSQVQPAEAAMAELRTKYGDITYYQQAQVLAQWGRSDEALACLEKALAASDAGVVRSRNDPLLDPIRKTVRFADVERNLGYV
jgi:TolB-like protein/predicted negative regulator of RcsB-dependent stress response